MSIPWYNAHNWIHFLGTCTVRCFVAETSKKEKRHVKNMIPFLVRKTSGGYVAHFPVPFVRWPFSDRPKHCNIVDLVSLIKL